MESAELVGTITSILDGGRLRFDEAYSLMSDIMQGSVDEVFLASLLTALRQRMESPEEIAGYATAMLDHAQKIHVELPKPIVDIVGTGGAPFKTFNVSTTSSLILPILGVGVAKHGNRSNSSPSGSADLLEALGVNINMGSMAAEKCLKELALTFMYAPNHHPAMKYVVPVRRALRFRTIFNLLGPLTNPAGVRRQVTGLFSPEYLMPIAESLQQRDYEHVILVYSELGADEMTNAGTTQVVELAEGLITSYSLRAEDFGLRSCNPVEITSLPPEESALECLRILSGIPSPRSEFVQVNSALALRVAGRTEPLNELALMVEEALNSGNGIDLLRKFVKTSDGDEDRLDRTLERI